MTEFQKNSSCQSRESGSTIVALLIIIVIVGIYASVAASNGENIVREAKTIESLGQKSELQKFIKQRTNCSITRSKNSGRTNDVMLFDRRGTRIDGKALGPMTVGKWTITVSSWNRSTGVITVRAQNKYSTFTSIFEPTDPLRCV